MKIFFAFLLTCIGSSVFAQDSWKISLDKKNLLNASTEDEQKNLVKIASADLKNSKTFEINYTEASIQKGWNERLQCMMKKIRS